MSPLGPPRPPSRPGTGLGLRARGTSGVGARPGALGSHRLPGDPGQTPPQATVRRPSAARERIVHHDDGEGNWLVSYADMMTLLFAFFVIMAAFSTPDAAKMERLKEATAKSMGGKYTKPFEDLTTALAQILKKTSLDKDVKLIDTGDGVAIIANGTLFFDSGSADLKEKAAELINNIAGILGVEAKGFKILVEGHTDDVPMVSKVYPSNWELSSARAGTVVRLLEAKGLARRDLRPLGLADTEPMVPNVDTSGVGIVENRAINRRIVIRIQRQLPKRMETSAAPQTSATP